MRCSAGLASVVLYACSGAPLPELPHLDFEGFLPSVRQEVQRAYAAAREKPRDSAVNGELAMVLHAHRQHTAAEICYRRVCLLEPDEFRWRYYLGVVQAAQNKHAEAVVTFREAVRRDPGYVPAWLRLADSLLELGLVTEAEAAYLEASQADPNSASAFYGRGRVKAAQGDLRGAAALYEKACEIFRDYGAAHYALALIYRRLGEDDASRRHMRLAEEHKLTIPPIRDPLLAEIQRRNAGAVDLVQAGLALEAEGKLGESVEAHLRALEADPNLVQAHVNLISLYGRLGETEKATQHYHAALRLNPDQAECHYNYGVLLFEQDRMSEAKQSFMRALEINPFYAEAHNNLGHLLEKEGRLTEALKHYREAVASKPDYRLARFHLGRALAHQRRYGEAIAQFRKILSPEDEQTPTYLYALGATYARSGDRSRAVWFLRQAREKAVLLGQTQLAGSVSRDLATLERGAAGH